MADEAFPFKITTLHFCASNSSSASQMHLKNIVKNIGQQHYRVTDGILNSIALHSCTVDKMGTFQLLLVCLVSPHIWHIKFHTEK
jgi:hypothetical protein